MAWTASTWFRVVIIVALAGYLVLNAAQGDWMWATVLAVALALNVWSLVRLRAPSQ